MGKEEVMINTILSALRNVSKWILLIPLIIPINIYLIGNSIGSGVQFALIRIQVTYLGWSRIFFWREFWIAAEGLITGPTAVSMLLWVGGTVLLIAATILILSSRRTGRIGIITYSLGCVLFMISTMVQYGPLFNGPAGVAIPIGLPFLIVIGYLLWKDAAGTATVDECDDDLSEVDDAAPLPPPGGADASADDT